MSTKPGVFQDGTPDVGVAGIARMLQRKEQEKDEMLALLKTAKTRKGLTAKSIQRVGEPFEVACGKLSTLRVKALVEWTGQRRAGHPLYKLTPAGEEALRQGVIS